MTSTNSLGLDLGQLSLDATPEIVDPENIQPAAETTETPEATVKKKEKPYVNAERANTGGPARVSSISGYIYLTNL